LGIKTLFGKIYLQLEYLVGLLLGVDTDLHDVVETEIGKHFIRMQLSDKISKLCWHLVVVYGPAQVEDKEEFLAKFAQLCNKCI
jgi:hypothetical protein